MSVYNNKNSHHVIIHFNGETPCTGSNPFLHVELVYSAKSLSVMDNEN